MPALTFPALLVTLSPHLVVVGVFLLVILGWIVLTLVMIYHWLTYSHAARIAIPAIIIHLIVSFVCVSYAFSGLV